jgi:D-glycerate 3-kinase
LAFKTLDALKNERSAVKIPRFDKAVDDRKSEDQWSTVQAPVDIIILEGWCVGIPAQAEQELEEAANELESTHDSQGTWRKYVNDQLREHYHPLWKEIDELIMLQAPSFDCVFQWRLEQEEKLVQANSGQNSADNKIMSAKEVENFIQHYERLTRHALEHLPQKSQYLLKLDAKRGITSFQNMNKDMNKGQSL